MRGFLSSIFQIFGPEGRRRRPTRARLAAFSTAALVVELLEKRECLAGDLTFTSGVLHYDTSTDTEVIVAANSAGKVTINGTATNYLARNVRKLFVVADNPEGVTVDLSNMTSRAFRGLRNTDIKTGSGNDTFLGSFATDNVFTGHGNDILHCSNGMDILNGGDGDDQLKVTMAGGNFYATDQYFSMYSQAGCKFGWLKNIDSIDLDSSSATRNRLSLNTARFTGDATVQGTKNSDSIITGSGDDIVVGGGGKDSISTNAGNDTVFASGGTIHSGAGDDFVDATEASSGVRIFDGSGNDIYNGSAFADTFIGLTGASGDDLVSAGAGNDVIDWSKSTSGNINLSGEDGNDVIRAGAGNAQLSGGAGDDDIYVGPGLTFVFGDDGNDFFDLTKGLDFFLFDPESGYWADKARTIFVPLP